MTEHVLVVNAGSSTCRLQLIDPADAGVSATALVDRLGSDNATYHVRVGTRSRSGPARVPDVPAAFQLVLGQFDDLGLDLTKDLPVAVGHRVVHGGPTLTRPTRIDDHVLAAIEAASPLAPAHNAAGLAGIRAARREFPGIPHVAVFDTAFFAQLPPAAATYAIDRRVASQYGIRRYGFHGISHEFVSAEAAKFLGYRPTELRQIVLHLGNGASASALDKGRPVDTSMGMTPLEGLVMGTRGGDLDPGVVLQLLRTARYDSGKLQELLGRHSGLLGLTGASDMRDVEDAADRGDGAALLALDVVSHRLRKYIGAYSAVLGGLDVLTFTAGIGENSPAVRARAVAGLEHLGIRLDPIRNAVDSADARLISTDDSRVAVLVVPTDEERAIARHTRTLLTDTPYRP